MVKIKYIVWFMPPALVKDKEFLPRPAPPRCDPFSSSLAGGAR
jgi:hypothetical protein